MKSFLFFSYEKKCLENLSLVVEVELSVFFPYECFILQEMCYCSSSGNDNVAEERRGSCCKWATALL